MCEEKSVAGQQRRADRLEREKAKFYAAFISARKRCEALEIENANLKSDLRLAELKASQLEQG